MTSFQHEYRRHRHHHHPPVCTLPEIIQVIN